MANILVGIEHGVEVAAEDVLKFLNCAEAANAKAGPQAIAGLGVLLGAVAKAVEDVSAATVNPLNIALDISTVQDLKSVWPALVAFAGSIGIKL